VHSLSIINDHPFCSHRGDGSISCSLNSTQHKFNVSIIEFCVSAAAVVIVCIVAVAAVVTLWAVCPLVALFTALVALALEWPCPLLVQAAGLLIVASTSVLVWAVTCLVPLFATMIARALELDIPQDTSFPVPLPLFQLTPSFLNLAGCKTQSC